MTLAIDPHEGPCWRRPDATGHVRQRPVTSDVELRHAGRQCHDVGQYGHGRADHFQAIQVERDGTQRAGRGVHQMPARHELRLAAAPQQRLLSAGSQVEDRHLRRLDPSLRRRDRKQHRPAAGQELRPEVIAFPALAVWCRQDRRFAAGGRHALEAGRRQGCRKNDAAVVTPGGPSALTVEAADGKHRSARDVHLLESDGGTDVDEADPLPIRRKERGLRRAQSDERRWLELIQCAHEELVAVSSGPLVDDLSSVPRDREIDADLVQGQCRGTRWREGKTR